MADTPMGHSCFLTAHSAGLLRRRFITVILIVGILQGCAQPAPELPGPLPVRVLEAPDAWPQPPPPLAVDDPRVQNDPQIRQRLHLEDNQPSIYLRSAELVQLSPYPTPAPFVPPSRSPFQFGGRITATIIPYQESALDRRDMTRTLHLDPEQPLRGVLAIEGSFHVHGPTHDLGVIVLFDYQQIEVTLGGMTARAHVVRIPQDRGVLYDFAIPDRLPTGNHTLTIVLMYDPTGLYTSYAVQDMYLARGRRGLTGRWLPLSAPYAWTIPLRVGADARLPAIDLQHPDRLPIPTNYLHGRLKLSRSSNPGDAITGIESHVLAADEAGRLYAFVTYDPVADDPQLQQTQAMLSVFLDDQQVPIAGTFAYFFDVHPGELYRIPIDLPIPDDGYVHTISAFVTFLPFLPAQYFDGPQPDWLTLAMDPRSARVVPLVPSRDWIPFFPPLTQE